MIARRIAWPVFASTFVLLLAGSVATWRSGMAMNIAETAMLDLSYLSIGVFGVLVATRHPRNPVGWMLIGIPFLTAVSLLGGDLLAYAVVERGYDIPAAGFIATLSPLGWGMSGGLILLTLHLFPDGRPLTRRWAWIFRLGAFGLWCSAIAILTSLEMNVRGTDDPFMLENPLGQFVGETLHLAFEYAALSIVPLVFLTPVVVFLRYRRSRGAERAQMKWLVYGVAVLVVGFPIIGTALTQAGFDPGGLLFALGLALLPATIGTAILKNRLYDIDVVISKTVVFAGLAALVTASRTQK